MYDIVRYIMAVGAALFPVAAIGSALGGGYSIYQQRRAYKAQKRATEVQRNQRNAELARARRKQIADARRRRAAVLNASMQTGGTGSSGEAQAVGSLQSQLGGNLGFMEQSGARAGRVEMFSDKANRASTNAAIGTQLTNIGTSIFSSGFSAPKAPQPQPRQANPTSPLFYTPGPR